MEPEEWAEEAFLENGNDNDDFVVGRGRARMNPFIPIGYQRKGKRESKGGIQGVSQGRVLAGGRLYRGKPQC